MKYLKFVLLFVLLISVTLSFHFYFASNFNSEIRFINDNADREIFHSRGLWYPLRKIPYLEVFSEYPQLGTYFFGLPHAILSLIHDSDYGKSEYRLTFSVITIIFLFASIVLLYKMREKRKYFAFFMLLPAALYFSYNRSDILPALLSLASIYLLSKERYKSSAFVLTLGILFKWYLMLLFPIFVTFYYSRHKKINWGMISIFCLTVILVILPTLLSGGVEALLVPYKFHTARGLNKESMFYLLKSILGSDAWFFIFFVMQFSVVPLCIISKIDSLQKVIKWSALSILVFMLFAKFYSPQWILWVLPFLILRAQNRKDVLPIIIFDLATYLYFPVIYDGCPNLLYPIVVVKTVIILYFIATIFKDLANDIISNRPPFNRRG